MSDYRLSEDDIRWLEKFTNAARPAPWSADDDGRIVAAALASAEPSVDADVELTRDDLAFIVLARNTMPHLLAELCAHRGIASKIAPQPETLTIASPSSRFIF
jgi:hypothetical protein